MRAAIYARYSTDQQNAKSTADQRRLCEAKLPDGAQVVSFHADEAVSGSTPIARRPGGRALLADVLAKRIDLLLVESLDRLSRDQVDLESTVRRIERVGIRIIGVADGYDSQAGGRKVLRTMRGLIGELYLDDLREKTRRGLTGKALAGFAVTGPAYGYLIEKADGGSRYVIDPGQATVVREIFDRYGSGESAQKIAHDLNRRAVPSPRGSSWAVSAIYGSPAKLAGILNNPLYVGRPVWNRSQWVKDDEGRRQRIDRPRSEWIESVDESLRIVSDEQWRQVRARIDTGRDPETGRKRAGRPTRTIFGGLLRCPKCHGAMIAVDARVYGCAARKDRGASVCEGFSVRRDRVDSAMLAMLRLMIERPEFEERFVAEVAAQLDDDSDSKRRGDRLRELDRQIARLVDAIAASGGSDALLARLKAAEAERGELRAAQAVEPEQIDARAIWREMKSRLSEMLAKGSADEMRMAVGELLAPILLQTNENGETWADVVMKAAAQGGRASKLVAGAGFEPATFGL